MATHWKTVSRGVALNIVSIPLKTVDVWFAGKWRIRLNPRKQGLELERFVNALDRVCRDFNIQKDPSQIDPWLKRLREVGM